MRLRNLLRQGFIAILWIGLWWAASALVGHSLLLPTPIETCQALFRLAGQGAFWLAIVASMARVLAGFLLGMVLGTLLAVLTTRFRWWHQFFSPMLATMKATPVASFIVLALIWIKTDGVPVFTTVLVVLPVVWANVSSGLTSIDAQLIEMTAAFKLGFRAKLRYLIWPSVRPYFYAAVTTSMGMAWKAGVAAEVIASPKLSLGGRLYDAKIYLDTPSMFANTVVIILLSVLLEKLVAWIVRGRERKVNI